MEHQVQQTEQKVLSVTDTSTVIENTQGDIEVVYGNPQNKLVDPPIVDEPENEDGNVPMQSASFQDSNHVPHTPRQSSSYTQNGNSSGSNRPLHNISPNNYPPKNSPASSSRKNLPHTDKRISIDSGPHQNINITPGASPTTSNNGSFNARTTNIKTVNNYYINWSPRPLRSRATRGLPDIEEDDIRDGGTSINTDPEQEYEPSSPSSYSAGNDTDVPTTPTTKDDLTVPQSLNAQLSTSDLDTPRKTVQASSPSPSTSTTHHLRKGLATASPLHSGQGNHNLGHTSVPNTRILQVDAPPGTAVPLVEHSLSASNLHPLLSDVLPGVGLEIRNMDITQQRDARTIGAINKLRHSTKSIKSSFKSRTRSMLSFKPFSSIATLTKASTVPEPLKIVKRVPVVALRGEEKVFAKNVDVYIHAELDPEPGLEPFHPLRDPNMTHKRLTDGSLPQVFSVNVYDVGYFDGGGRFILLFNLQKTKEQNEELLKFQFKTTSFSPLAGCFVHQVPSSKERFQIWNDKKIVPDRISSEYNESKSLEYMCRFKVRSQITKGTAIVMMGQVRRYVDGADVITQQDYFEAQSIEWYRHAKGERNRYIENGDLVLITECYKAPSWAYINYQFDEEELETTRDTWAAFQPGMKGKGLHGWVYESPPLVGLESSQHRSTEEDPTAGPPDQCIGIRAYSIHCDPQAWKSMCKELKSRRTPRS